VCETNQIVLIEGVATETKVKEITVTPTCPPQKQTGGAGDYTGKPPSETTEQTTATSKEKYREKIQQKIQNWFGWFGKKNTKGGSNHDSKPPVETIHGR
jgi:hypothetical protein